MRNETWVLVGCALIGLFSFQYGALLAATQAAIEADLTDPQIDAYTDQLVAANTLGGLGQSPLRGGDATDSR